MTKELLQQALDALENSVDLVVNEHLEAVRLYGDFPPRQHKINVLKLSADLHEQAIKALNEALAQRVHGGKTGWPEGLLQDDSRDLSRWLSNTPNAKQEARDAAEQAQPVQPAAKPLQPHLSDEQASQILHSVGKVPNDQTWAQHLANSIIQWNCGLAAAQATQRNRAND